MSNFLDWLLSLFKPKAKAVSVSATGSGPAIAFINATTVLSDEQIAPVVQALQVMVTRDFAPVWGAPASLVQVPKGGTPPSGAWWMVLMDNSDVASALGYHYDTTPEDLPIGKIFVKTTMDAGEEWTVCAAHELQEALADPYINKCDQDSNGIIYAHEVSDAVEADDLAYEINGIRVSDFVTPAWFDPGTPSGRKVDFLGHLSKPFELAPGGYIGVLDPNNPATGWTIVTADKDPKTIASSRATVGSRRDRRRTPRHLWIKA